MRISCNGCRVLRKGCTDTCTIRPCLDWIKSSESQANATVFLAKFYGRAGLVNLINAGPQHLRPAIFTSLIYEACGRIVNPIYGSAGLLSSGNWHLCQEAVEAVLKGSPITPMAIDAVETKTAPPMKAYDIRHVNKEGSLSESNDLPITKRCRFRRSGGKKAKRSRVWVDSGDEAGREEVLGSPSHGSSLSHQSEPNAERESQREESLASADPSSDSAAGEDERLADMECVDLDLTLGLKPFKRCDEPKEAAAAEMCKIQLGVLEMEGGD